MSETMLPCPFCGGEAELTTRKFRNGSDGYRYRCSKCHATIGEWSGGISGHPWTAVEKWNTRFYTEYGAVPATEENMAKHGWYRRETCHDIRTDYKILFECSECGWSCADTYACDEIAFCPGCGRKVSA